MTAFLPAEHYPPDSTHLPLLATIVGVERRQRKEVRFRVKAGKLFHYRVALKNVSKQPFQFKSCPVYVEGLASNTREERHVLNCRPVGSLDAAERVVFEMVLQVPADTPLGNNGLSWELGQKTADPPFANAAVLVRR